MALTIDQSVLALKAAAEPTRLRILALLQTGPLNVKDLTRVLGQSQPRISRHLKLLGEAQLVERSPEGSWVYFHLAAGGPVADLARQLVAAIDNADPVIARDRERARLLKEERAKAAQRYFERHAAEWDRIRALYVPEDAVEAVVAGMAGADTVDLLVDLGTGTGRILELLAPRAGRAIGFDINQSMLAYARARLERLGIRHAQVRLGDLYNLPLADGTAGLVVMHQVLHFLPDPAAAIREAARILAPGGRLLVVDFAPHQHEFLRETYAHERLGFSREQVGQWLAEAGLAAPEVQTLEPDTGDGVDRITVLIWAAGKAGARRTTQARQLQVAR